jgi:phage terminase large subunit-like protein
VDRVGVFPELEEQMTSWTPESGDSPDRLDSALFGATELMLQEVTHSSDVLLRSA